MVNSDVCSNLILCLDLNGFQVTVGSFTFRNPGHLRMGLSCGLISDSFDVLAWSVTNFITVFSAFEQVQMILALYIIIFEWLIDFNYCVAFIYQFCVYNYYTFCKILPNTCVSFLCSCIFVDILYWLNNNDDRYNNNC